MRQTIILILATLTTAFSPKAQAQEAIVISEPFSNLADWSGSGDYNGWGTSNCSKSSDNNIFMIGTSTSYGSLVSPALSGNNGKLSFRFKTADSTTKGVKFRITLSNGKFADDKAAKDFTISKSSWAQSSEYPFSFTEGSTITFETLSGGSSSRCDVCIDDITITTYDALFYDKGPYTLTSSEKTFSNILNPNGGSMLTLKVKVSSGTKKLTVTTPSYVYAEENKSSNISNTTEQTLQVPILHQSVSTISIGLSGSGITVSDIMVTDLPDVTFANDASEADISSIVSEYADKWVNVTLADRTISSSYWNTLCLPFDVDQYYLSLDYGGISNTRQYTGVTGDVMNFVQFPAGSPIAAGTPFLVKPSSTVDTPHFSCVKISAAEAATIPHDGYSLCGTYAARNLATNGSELFLSTDGHFYTPAASTATMGSMRAFFSVPESSDSRSFLISDVVPDDSEATGVTTVRSAHLSDTAVYDLCGRRVFSGRSGQRADGGQSSRRLARGLYISHGRKFLVK